LGVSVGQSISIPTFNNIVMFRGHFAISAILSTYSGLLMRQKTVLAIGLWIDSTTPPHSISKPFMKVAKVVWQREIALKVFILYGRGPPHE
jgi:hypothetical protein